jgi:4-nitrophenyl phosphatase
VADELDLARIAGVTLDMDGTLWRGEAPLPGLAEFFAFLAARGLPHVLVTNNAFWPAAHYVAKLARFGVAIRPEQVLTSAGATAAWLAGELPAGARVYVVGGEALRRALAAAGLVVVDNAEEPVAAVVAGIDFALTYDKLRDATRLIRGGARFVGTNPDTAYPMEDGLAPGAGSILAALAAASGTQPEVVGKPNRPLFNAALERLGTAASVTLMVGDRLDTDILGARKAGLRTAFVTTGVDGPAAIAQTGIVPDTVFDGLDALRAAWPAARP